MNQFALSVIDVRGTDAESFLQNQLATDLSPLTVDDPAQLSAWCNPKGRVICLFRVLKTVSGFSLALPDDLADSVVNRLTMFRFRADVTFELSAFEATSFGIAVSADEWRRQNLLDGIPEIREAQSEAFTAHMLNLDELGAVSVDKGCYPGQEIVARTHFRGASKRRLFRLVASVSVTEGIDIHEDGGDKIGTVVNVIERDLLAVCHRERLAGPLRAGDAELRLALQ